MAVDLGGLGPDTLTFRAKETAISEVCFLHVHGSNMVFEILLGRELALANWAG